MAGWVRAGCCSPASHLAPPKLVSAGGHHHYFGRLVDDCVPNIEACAIGLVALIRSGQSRDRLRLVWLPNASRRRVLIGAPLAQDVGSVVAACEFQGRLF
ncbi:MAG: hypothetical protein NZ899_01600 [Thermoguttaceae bacterium]|nr:hypothetical protein [Thermoguttaceae bacterium]MDW8078629.1 hypothetical protein [Thermoguttaceae bacterium]